jgi:hypothetical protein
MFRTRVILVVAGILEASNVFAADHFPAQLCGPWKITQVITSAPIVGNSTVHIGSQISIGPNDLSIDKGACNSPLRQRETQTAHEFREGYKLEEHDMRLLSLPNRIVLYETECITIIPKVRNEAVIEDSGIFWAAIRVSSRQNSKDHNGSTKPLHGDH